MHCILLVLFSFKYSLFICKADWQRDRGDALLTASLHTRLWSRTRLKPGAGRQSQFPPWGTGAQVLMRSSAACLDMWQRMDRKQRQLESMLYGMQETLH